MTAPFDPPALPPAPPPAPTPFAEAPAAAAEPWQRRLEVLALLLVVAVIVVLIASFVAANAQLGSATFDPFGNAEPAPGLSEIVRVGGAAANLMVAGALLVALLLVTLGPGDRISARGTVVLGGLVGVGLLSAGAAGISSVLTVLHDDGPTLGENGRLAVVGEGLVGRVSGVAPLVVAAVIAGYVAWCAFATLGDVPPEPLVPDAGPTPDLGTSAGGDWAPPPAPLP